MAVEGIEVHLSFKRNLTPRYHQGYHGDPERRKMRMVKIVSDIYVRGTLSEEEKKILLEEAAHCPLHQTLLNPPELEERIHLVQEKEEVLR